LTGCGKRAEQDSKSGAVEIRNTQTITGCANRAHSHVVPEAWSRSVLRRPRKLQAQSDTCGGSCRQTKDRSEAEPIANAEQRAIGDGPGQSSQRTMFAAEQIICEIQRSQQIKRTTNDADQRDDVLIDHLLDSILVSFDSL